MAPDTEATIIETCARAAVILSEPEDSDVYIRLTKGQTPLTQKSLSEMMTKSLWSLRNADSEHTENRFWVTGQA